MTPALLFPNSTGLRAVTAAVLFSISWPLLAHEGHDHGAIARPADVRIAPRFEVRSEEVEMVGVLAGEELVIYLDRADNNAPIQGAQIEVEGQGIKGVATNLADGVYGLSAPALAQAGKYSLMMTVQAGQIADLLSADLLVEEKVPAASADSHGDRQWWWIAGILLLILSGMVIGRRLHRPSK
ncbi:MAG: hypothetical protein V5B39_13860 [Accumulibacter sp.]|jgi:cobalt-zinc-cadmium efflux system membrane fusion protein|uniref:hypothetical protein n=1 Tax=Accumulibacter sp. TaxID=2053492 RepID=UPI002FC2BFA7